MNAVRRQFVATGVVAMLLQGCATCARHTPCEDDPARLAFSSFSTERTAFMLFSQQSSVIQGGRWIFLWERPDGRGEGVATPNMGEYLCGVGGWKTTWIMDKDAWNDLKSELLDNRKRDLIGRTQCDESRFQVEDVLGNEYILFVLFSGGKSENWAIQAGSSFWNKGCPEKDMVQAILKRRPLDGALQAPLGSLVIQHDNFSTDGILDGSTVWRRKP
jgi:hypothetical protein